ncbi:MAG TPA: cytochrome c biogenesis CcdA family protein [Ktedonobacteraceae bacterium]|jgi:cytochrome c-type biogenesis protein|nr:cytochrome c biogenesis CcdA family protein [Ktedonobacteraceae bacterium]
MDSSQLSFGVAFLAGLASFLSPCVLPLVPIYLAQLVGQSVYQASGQQQGTLVRVNTFVHAAIFVFGFTLAFISLGATASTLGGFLKAHQFLLRQVGGILLVLIGLHLIGVLRVPFLYWQKRFEFHPNRPSYTASFVIGLIFAIGWTPCIGLILGPILVLASNAGTLQQGVLLLLAYSLGLGIPFLLLGLGLDRMSKLLKWLKPHAGKIEIGTGIIMILVGIMIYFNLLLYLNRFFNVGVNV